MSKQKCMKLYLAFIFIWDTRNDKWGKRNTQEQAWTDEYGDLSIYLPKNKYTGLLISQPWTLSFFVVLLSLQMLEFVIVVNWLLCMIAL